MPNKTTARRRATGALNREQVAEIENMLHVLKVEQYRLLTNYLYLNPDDLNLYVDVTDNGEYVLTVRAVTDKLIDVGRVLA